MDATARELEPRRVISQLLQQWPTATVAVLDQPKVGVAEAIVEGYVLPVVDPDHPGAPEVLARLVRRGRDRRDRELARAADFSRRCRLSGLGATVAALIAVHEAYERQHELIGHEQPRQFRQLCSRAIYPRVGVRSWNGLVYRVLAHERE